MNDTEKQATQNNTSLNEYIPKKKFALSADCPVTRAELDWIFKKRATNGFAKSFVKFSARGFLVHTPSFIDCLIAKRGG